MLRAVGDPVDVHEIDHVAMRTAIDQLQQIHHQRVDSSEPKVGSNEQAEATNRLKYPR
jgi:chemotaxis protein CheY-P-specific phosphatase CheC